ncbi:MAG: chromosomal replication initiator protein DnaA [Oscillospiraceae bacterium]|nr:chromosomal replication initiator protein DnaA [Oscillospiraceae bacterium]
MNSLDDIWQSILKKLSSQLTPTAINTWFSDCQPVELGEKRLVLQTSSDFKRNIILQRFGQTIRDALADLFACEFDILVLVGDELDEYKREGPDDNLPEAAAYTFDRFIVGQSNKFAHAAAIAVSENPGTVYNPLFIYGNSGLGKTHLLLAIGQAIRERNPSVKIGYVKGDEFTNQMITSLREATQEQFRQRYRNVELFLVDDIQFIAGKIAVQEEFFHTFNNIYEAGHQIVITSDRPPLEMVKLEDRLRTRFEGGLMADIQPPDLETRMAIIRNKSQGLGLVLSDEVVDYIAENLTSNIRQIEGVVHRLTAYRDIMDDSISITSVKRAIKDVIRTGLYVPTPDAIITETSRFYGIDEADIRGQRRSKNTAMARQMAMYLIRSLTNLSLVDIGEMFDHRNHSTVLSSIRKVEDLVKTDPDTAASVREISANLNSRGQ